MQNYLYLGLAIVCEVIATSFLAKSDGFTKLLPTAVALVGYGISFYLLALTLRVVPTGIAYAIWSGVGIAGLRRGLFLAGPEAGRPRSSRHGHDCGRRAGDQSVFKNSRSLISISSRAQAALNLAATACWP